MPGIQDLSERELEILRLVATGASNKEIAQKLFISANTVKVHLRNIFAKIQVGSRTEAAIYAVNSGLVSTSIVLPDSSEPNLDTGQASQPAGNTNTISASYQEPSGISKPDEKTKRFAGARLWVVGIAVLVIASGLIFAFWMINRANRAQRGINLPSPGESPRWQTLQAMPNPRSGLALAAFENKIYAIAGETAQGPTNLVERYDPANNIWVSLATKPTEVSDIQAVVIGARIFVPGGKLNSGQVCNLLEIYDLHQDRWSQGKSLPIATSGYALVAFEGKLFLFGGWNGNRALDIVLEYDPVADTWNEKTPMKVARAYAGAALAGGQISVLGGFDGSKSLTDNEAYLPDQDFPGGRPWVKSPSMAVGRYRMGVASLADIILVVGGINEKTQPLLSIEYFPPTHTWQEIGSLGVQSWSNFGIVSLGTRIYLLGGLLDGQLTGQNLSYQAIYTINMPIIR